MRVLTIIALVTAAAVPAWAQPEPPERDLTVDVLVNYDGNYRADTWTPVDVLVVNNDRDIEGSVEVRTFFGSQLHSPVYRVPAVSPLGSTKRFRLYCKLEGADRIEAQIYDGNRRMLEVPMYQTITPVDATDLMGMLLTEDPVDFGFVLTVLQKQDPSRSFFRKRFDERSLDLLPDHVACLEPYSFIAIGDVEMERLPQAQRNVIEQYVRGGGCLVIMTGENTYKVAAPWVQHLAGVSFGEQETLTEAALAAQAFPPEKRDGALERRDCTVTALLPTASEVTLVGQERTVAALRPFGGGYVATFAVDASTGALQECVGFQDLWRDILFAPRGKEDLPFIETSALLTQNLPNMVGIQLYSKSSVMTYLVLYFVVAIVLNWIVCSMLRRREWAWVFLVICSIGFTTYAVVFGTAGRAKASEREQIEIVHIPEGAASGNVRTYLGLLTARTNRYAFELGGADALVDDVQAIDPTTYRSGYSPGAGRPFTFVQAADNSVNDLAIGASEMRLLSIDSTRTLEGPITGEVVMSRHRLEGRFVNETGVPISRAFLAFDGRFYECTIKGDDIIPGQAVANGSVYGPNFEQWRNYRDYFWYYQQRERLADGVIASLSFDEMRGGPALDFGPVLLAVAARAPLWPMQISESMTPNILETVLVAEVDVRRAEDATAEPVSLMTSVQQGSWSPGSDMPLHSVFGGPFNAGVGLEHRIAVEIPHELQFGTVEPIIFDLWYVAQAPVDFSLGTVGGDEGAKPETEPLPWPQNEPRRNNLNLYRATFELNIADAALLKQGQRYDQIAGSRYVAPRNLAKLPAYLDLRLTRSSEPMSEVMIVHAHPRMMRKTSSTEEVWPAWQ